MTQWRGISSLFMAALISLILLAPAAYADDGNGHHGGGHGNTFFDPSAIVTVSGVLEARFDDWEMWGHGNHTGGGMHFEFEADGGKHYDLMLAPAWYLEDNGIVLSNGDRITITGSVVSPYASSYMDQGHMGGQMGDEDYLIATELQAGGTTLKLRDSEGYPLWRGGPGWHGGSWFDPDTVATMRGRLQTGLGFWSSWGFGNYTGNGMHYLFKSNGGETFYAMLAPWWFLEENGIELSDGLKAKLTGSLVGAYWQGYDDYRYIIVTRLTVGGVTVQLRDEYGYPLWHGTGLHYFSPAWEDGQAGTVSGTVRSVRTRSHGKNLDPGYEVILNTGNGRYRVFVAPQWYVENIDFSIAKGDRIKVRGALIAGGNRGDIVARQVVHAGQRWRFRNSRGNPTWVSGAK